MSIYKISKAYFDSVYVYNGRGGLTASDASVFGTAISISAESWRSCMLSEEPGVGSREPRQAPKGQKFIVLTSSMCSIHGCGRGKLTSSSGGALLRRSSSARPTFQTINL
jgi:hypothetical protein